MNYIFFMYTYSSCRQQIKISEVWASSFAKTLYIILLIVAITQICASGF